MTRSIGLLLALFLFPVFALAANPEKVEESKRLFKEGQLHFDLGRPDAALASYSKAYEANPLPEFLFNIGQCHLQLGHYERAIFFYEGYLRGKKDAANRAVVEGRMVEARVKLEEQKVAAKAAADDLAAKKAADDAAAAAEREAQIATSKALGLISTNPTGVPTGPRTTPVYRKWWFLPVLAGVALAAGGGAYATRGTRTEQPHGSLETIDRR